MEGAEQKVGPRCGVISSEACPNARLDGAAGKAATRLMHTALCVDSGWRSQRSPTLRSPARPQRPPLDDGAARRGAMSSPVRMDTLGYSAALEGAPPA